MWMRIGNGVGKKEVVASNAYNNLKLLAVQSLKIDFNKLK